MSIKSGTEQKFMGSHCDRVKSWPNVASRQLQSRKKYNKKVETLLAKQIFSLLFWDRPLKFMLQHPTMWSDRKQSKYPSKELLLYDSLHKRLTDVWKTVTNSACSHCITKPLKNLSWSYWRLIRRQNFFDMYHWALGRSEKFHFLPVLKLWWLPTL